MVGVVGVLGVSKTRNFTSKFIDLVFNVCERSHYIRFKLFETKTFCFQQEKVHLIMIVMAKIITDVAISIPIVIGYNAIQSNVGNSYYSLRNYYMCKQMKAKD